MSSAISTPDELSSNSHAASGTCWRVVEGQHLISTAKLVDNAAEHDLLEAEIEAAKPPVPAECGHLDYLLFSPFRYRAPSQYGSRFKRPGLSAGVFYGAVAPSVAIAEIAFLRLLMFYGESPETPWPRNAGEYTAFSAGYATKACVDLQRSPFNERRSLWSHPTDYAACQAFAELAREAGIQVIKYSSVRDPRHRTNLAILSCLAFSKPKPLARQSWKILLTPNGVRCFCDMPKETIDFDRAAFASDPRIAAMRWQR